MKSRTAIAKMWLALNEMASNEGLILETLLRFTLCSRASDGGQPRGTIA
jgi:hypothetical protein